MAKTIALIFGVIYTLIGIAGFVPAIGGTVNMEPGTVLLGIAKVNLLHNIVHLLIGVLGLAAAGDEARASMYCKTFGVILIVLGILGFVIPTGFGFVPIDGYDIYIHLVTGVILAFVGFRSASGAMART